MNFKERLYDVAAAFLPARYVFAEYHKRGGGKKAEWTREADLLSAKAIADWKSGVGAATDPENPRRGSLMRFNKSLMLDNHLASVIDTRILKVQRASYNIVNDRGEENEELKKLLERPFHFDLMRLTLFSQFQGPTLIEMFDIDPDTQELIGVEEIPQSNFIPQKGIIIKDEYDDTGVDYRTGIMSDYYFQVGGDWDLGILNQLAMTVLAKKLSVGSWMSYVDKYGVPPIFFITDRMDTGRRDELFEMGSNFRQNMFAVLQGNERIEVPHVSETNAYQTFLSLIEDFCNKEISKRVLGGTSTTDEKSFVGSAEIQERIAQDRNEADKLFYKHIFNTKIRQRLVKISPVYKDFATHTLVWDNQETLDINGYIEAIGKLAGHFDFDVKEIRERTGLPVVSAKQLFPSTQVQEEPDDNSKKKVDAIAAIVSRNIPQLAIPPTAATWDAAVEWLVNQIWENKIKPESLNRDLVLKYYAGLNKSAQQGWGGGYYTNELTRQFRENLLKFSGAKSYNLIQKIEALKSEAGEKAAYLEESKKLVGLHNETWQWTEEKFAANSASAARDFQVYQQDADIYPNLKFRTMGDDHVRPEHVANEGVIKPVNEWTKIPPLDAGCRCFLEQTTEKPTGNDISVYDDKIAGNPALTGELFTGKNGYFQNIAADAQRAVYANTDLMKEYMPYNRQIKAGENSVYINDFADLNDLQPNIDAAKIVAEFLSKDIYIRPHITIAQGHPNPEFGIGTPNRLADLKTMTEGSKNFFASRMRSANKQGCEAVVMNIDNYKGNISDLYQKIKIGFVRDGKEVNTNISKIFVIRNGKVAQLTRKQVSRGLFGDLDKL